MSVLQDEKCRTLIGCRFCRFESYPAQKFEAQTLREGIEMDTVVILAKPCPQNNHTDHLAIISLGLLSVGVRNEPERFDRGTVYPSHYAACAAFGKVLHDSLRDGWTVAYCGPRLLDGGEGI
jgi:hypothetical protein